jgi:cell division protein FtsW
MPLFKRKKHFRRESHPADTLLLLAVLILVSASLVVIYSASSARAYDLHGDSSFYFSRQLMRVLIGLLGMIFLARFNYRNLRFFGVPLLVLAVCALVVVLIPGVVEPIKGARRAFSLAGQSFQPAEIAKFALIIFFADSIARRGKNLRSWTGYLKRLLVIGLVTALIILQPDFSTGMMLGLLGIFLLYLGGTKLGYLLITALVAIPVGIKVAFMEPYRIERIKAYIDSLLHPENLTHQVNQSLIGLGDGGLLGLGLGMSYQKQYFLPEPFTDFVFSILGEELGLIGTVSAVILYIIIALRGMRIARHAPDQFGFLLAGGVSFAIISYAMVNMLVVTGLLPVSGLPLPFLTYGGSSLVFTMFMVGILLNISRNLGSASAKSPGANVIDGRP